MSETETETLEPGTKMPWQTPELQRLDIESAEANFAINSDGVFSS
jgi:hypothetical protein